ncbi:hypothetical protein VUJ46_13620 [Chryseobacterium sp. MYb264]|uniref:hypothetical protein n=1 Tax=Chryseobacterium sp. MYb264 TaxID=2745153 RepID=UPI002E14A227|nr:hypothetical protein VUJ46_13620 [Chryseobacterium sp. MYb264]
MSFDTDMIKKIYKRYLERVFAALQMTGEPLTFTKKFYPFTVGAENYLTYLKQGATYTDFAFHRFVSQHAKPENGSIHHYFI